MEISGGIRYKRELLVYLCFKHGKRSFLYKIISEYPIYVKLNIENSIYNPTNMDWFGGKAAGSVRKVNNSFQVTIANGSKSFAISSYNSPEETQRIAEEWRANKSLELGLTKNLIGLVDDGGEPYLKVQLQEDIIMECDVEHINIVEDSVWTAWKGKGCMWYVRRRNSKKTGQTEAMFHTLVHPEFIKPKHLDGNSLNNRSNNIYDASKPKTEVQRNNTSGIQGVYKAGNEWCVQIKTKNARMKKSFTINKYGDVEAFNLAVQQRKEWEDQLNFGCTKSTRKYHNFRTKLNTLNVHVITTEDEYLNMVDTEKYPELLLECQDNHQFSLRITSLYNKLDFLKKNPMRNICSECEKPTTTVEEHSVREKCKTLGFTFCEYNTKTRSVNYICNCGSKNITYATNLTKSGRQAQCPKCQNEKFKIETSTVKQKLEQHGCILVGKYTNTHTPITYICVCNNKVKMRYCEFIVGKKCRHCGYGVMCEHNVYLADCTDCSITICEHNNYYTQCDRCNNGTTICEHGSLHLKCIDCNPQYACQNCASQYVHQTSKFYPNCFRCYCILNPNSHVPIRYKFKEHYLRDFLEETFTDISLIFDKTLGACSRRRPDVFIECMTHCIVIECDENQHKSYGCENKRMMEIFQDVGNRPTVFIRFNPDSYVVNGLAMKSCFKRTKIGILTLVKDEWEKRTKLLKNTVEKYIKNIPTKELTIERLFYTSAKLG